MFNICLAVEDVAGLAGRMTGTGAPFLLPPTTLQDSSGKVELAVVAAPCDGVVHSLVDIR